MNTLSAKPKISLIICTRNRSEELVNLLLPSLQKLIFTRLEIIIVDSSSDKQMVEKNKNATLNLGYSYFWYGKKGLSNARNFAIKQAQGDFIVFTDDDCVVDPTWLQRLIRGFNDINVYCCTGRTLSWTSSKESQEIWERLKTFDRGENSVIVGKKDINIRHLLSVKRLANLLKFSFSKIAPAPWCLGYGNNMAFRRDVFQELGDFDTRLGRGVPTESGEEVDLYYRILKAGHKIIYDPTAIVRHEHRQTIDMLFEASYTAGLGTAAFVFKHFKDPYMVVIYFGRACNILLALLFSYRITKLERKLMFIELIGWLKGPSVWKKCEHLQDDFVRV